MRKELEIPQIEEGKRKLAEILIDKIADRPLNCEAELSELNRITGKDYDETEFSEYWSWTDLSTIAKIALTPVPPLVQDLSETEIAEIVDKIRISFINGEEHVIDYYEELLHKSLPLVDVFRFIDQEGSPEEIAAKIKKAAANSVILL